MIAQRAWFGACLGVVSATVLSFSSSAHADAGPTIGVSGAPIAGDETEPRPLTKKEREKVRWLDRLKISGYLQPQLITQQFNAEASPNGNPLPPGIGANQVTAKSDGTTTNSSYFKMRRARLKVEYWAEDWARFVFEIDPFAAGGTNPEAGTIARNVEAIGVAKWSDDAVTEFGVGIFKVPFGFEILQSDADRPFIERSAQEQNLFPGEFEYGARAYTSLLNKKLQLQVAVTNGQMQAEKNFTKLPDLNNGKDVIGRVNYDFGPFDFGVSGILGKGIIVDPGTGGAGGRTKSYGRWGVDVEAALHHTFSKDLGKTAVFAELVYANNLDRGTKYSFELPAFPSPLSADVANLKEMGFFIRAEQEIGKWVSIAARYDRYTPDTTLDKNTRQDIGGVFVVRMGKGLELRSEYARILDDVHKSGGQPANKKIHFMSYVLQTRF